MIGFELSFDQDVGRFGILLVKWDPELLTTLLLKVPDLEQWLPDVVIGKEIVFEAGQRQVILLGQRYDI